MNFEIYLYIDRSLNLFQDLDGHFYVYIDTIIFFFSFFSSINFLFFSLFLRQIKTVVKEATSLALCLISDTITDLLWKFDGVLGEFVWGLSFFSFFPSSLFFFFPLFPPLPFLSPHPPSFL